MSVFTSEERQILERVLTEWTEDRYLRLHFEEDVDGVPVEDDTTGVGVREGHTYCLVGIIAAVRGVDPLQIFELPEGQYDTLIQKLTEALPKGYRDLGDFNDRTEHATVVQWLEGLLNVHNI